MRIATRTAANTRSRVSVAPLCRAFTRSVLRRPAATGFTTDTPCAEELHRMQRGHGLLEIGAQPGRDVDRPWVGRRPHCVGDDRLAGRVGLVAHSPRAMSLTRRRV